MADKYKLISKLCLICFLRIGFSAEIDWIATSNNELLTSTNWSPQTVPGSGDDAIFNSAISGVNISPTADSPFSVATLQFLNQASPFTFTFNNSLFSIAGGGIEGTHTNTSILLANTDNSSSLVSQLVFSSIASSGSASITAKNIGFNSGETSSTNSSFLSASQVLASQFLTAGTSGSFTLLNQGRDSSTDLGGNKSAYISGSQFSMGSSFLSGSGFNLTITNSGNATDTSTGSNDTGYVANYQALFSNSAAFGSSSTINVSNSGTDTGSGINNNTGSIGEAQVSFANTFSMADGSELYVSNSGSLNGINGSKLAGIVRNDQLQFGNRVTVGEGQLFQVTNYGGCQGGYTFNGNNAGVILGNQISGTGLLQAQDSLFIAIQNLGLDTSVGVGGDLVAYVSDGQLSWNASMNLTNSTTISLANLGRYAGYNSTTGNTVGYVGTSQFNVSGGLTADSNLQISITNQGTNIGPGSNNTVGYVDGDQFYIDGLFSTGNSLNLSVSNDGTNRGSGSSNQVGYINGHQIDFHGAVSLSDGTVISASNADSGIIAGSQIFFEQGFSLTGSALFAASNTGTIGGHGIVMPMGTGGNAAIVLSGTDLYISSLAPTFTIQSLTGDSGSSINCAPTLLINLAPSSNAVFRGTIPTCGGATSLTIQGSGSQTLSGTCSFNGLTQIESGILVLNTSLSGNVTIEPSGTLKGNGSANIVYNTGTIAPGQSIGTLSFTQYTQDGGTYFTQVNGAQASLISVSGPASILSGVVEVDSPNNSYTYRQKLSILYAAGDVSGAYSGTLSPSPMIIPALSYDRTHVYLDLIQNTTLAAKTHNQFNVAKELDSILDPTLLQNTLINEVVTLPLSSATQALDNLSGWQYAGNINYVQNINESFIRRLYNPLRFIITDENCRCKKDCEIWVEGTGNFTTLQGNPNAHGFHTTGAAATLGLQTTVHSNWTIGGAFNCEYDELKFKNHGGNERISSYLLGFYGLYSGSRYYALADLSFDYSAAQMTRKMGVGLNSYKSQSDPNLFQATVYAEFGGRCPLGPILLQPFIGITGAFDRANQVTESGNSGWELQVKQTKHNLVKSRVGFHLTAQPNCHFISLDFAWNQRFTGRDQNVHAHFLNFGDSFNICGVALSNTSLDYALTLSQPFGQSRIYIQALGQWWNHCWTNSAVAGLEVCF